MRIVATLLFALVFLPAITAAQTAPALEAQITALLQQLAALQAQLRSAEQAALTPSPALTAPLTIVDRHRFCRAYSRELKRGLSGDDVRALQEFLITEGMFAGEPTGYFGPITVEALQAWQAREGIVSSGSEAATGWGVFGPRTHAHFTRWCGGIGATAALTMRASPTFGIAPLEVDVTTNISGFRAGNERYVIDFGDGTIAYATPCFAPFDTCDAPGVNTHTYTKNGTYTVRLIRTTSPCPIDNTCGIPGTAKQLSTLSIQVTDTQACSREPNHVCALQRVTCVAPPCGPVEVSFTNRCLMEAAGATFLYEGQCRPATADPSADAKCSAWFDGCNTCTRTNPGAAGACTRMYCTPPEGQAPKPYCSAYFE